MDRRHEAIIRREASCGKHSSEGEGGVWTPTLQVAMATVPRFLAYSLLSKSSAFQRIHPNNSQGLATVYSFVFEIWCLDYSSSLNDRISMFL